MKHPQTDKKIIRKLTSFFHNREELFAWLSQGAVISSIQIRDIFGYFNPSDCIYRFRKKGFRIHMLLGDAFDRDGNLHHGVAYYRLEPSKKQKPLLPAKPQKGRKGR